MSNLLITPSGVLSFPHLYVARPPVRGAEPRFSCTIIFDAAAQATPEYKALKEAAHAVALAEFGSAKLADKNFMKKFRSPFRDASEKSYEGYDEGSIFISPWTKKRPGVVDARLQDITVPDDVWAGQLVRGDVNPFAYSEGGNYGVSFGLNNIQVIKRKMPRLDGRRAANKAFGALEIEDEEALPMGAAPSDDDIPF